MYRRHSEYYDRSRFNPSLKKLTKTQLYEKFRRFAKRIEREAVGSWGRVIDRDKFEKRFAEWLFNDDYVQKKIERAFFDVTDTAELDHWGMEFTGEEEED